MREAGAEEVDMAVGEEAALEEAEVEDLEVVLGVEAADGDASHLGIPRRYYGLSLVYGCKARCLGSSMIHLGDDS